MPVYPITLHVPKDAASYPHMAKRDTEVWRRFLVAHGAEFIAFSYDVALGGVTIDAPGEDPETVRAYQYSTALKIDAIGWKGNQAWIIEVKPDATMSGFGAALGYTIVAQREAFTDLPLVPCVVCESMQLDVEWLCAKTGVQVIKV